LRTGTHRFGQTRIAPTPAILLVPALHIVQELLEFRSADRGEFVLLQEPQQVVDDEAACLDCALGMLAILAIEEPFTGVLFGVGGGEGLGEGLWAGFVFLKRSALRFGVTKRSFRQPALLFEELEREQL